MPRSHISGNFIDQTFSIVTNILLRVIPTTLGEKDAFTYYRDDSSIKRKVTPRDSVLRVNPTLLALIGSIGEEALHLGINNTKTLF
ncbi:hypothetical protein RND71_019231 [Anisodus tanguticus]|uniref:Uncharacterized protein n=1 Tax=Anisodus tanguticus TaxID=243964 RepID=A0AAE1VG97_9SOLA|nr:hypothetical protein RND71_019231 [Anisodus tanguticus]